MTTYFRESNFQHLSYRFTILWGPQADFDICCAVFCPLQNGKKFPEKTFSPCVQKALTMLKNMDF